MLTEEMITNAAFEVRTAMLNGLPDPDECTHQFSEAFERKMKKLIWRANHFIAYKALQRAASILIAFILSASMFLAFNTEARAIVVNWLKEYAHGVYNYFFMKEPNDITAEYSLGWVPEGYLLEDSLDTPTGKSYFYFNSERKLLQFVVVKGAESLSLTSGKGEYERKYISENSLQAEIILALAPDMSNGIVWEEDNGNVVLSISGFFNEQELIMMAKSVVAN